MKNITLLTIVFIFISCSSPSVPIKIDGQTMGTYYRVSTYGSISKKELKEDIDKFLKLYNDIFSTYIKTSEISKINESTFDNNKLTEAFRKVMQLSILVSKKSYGFFDVTVGPLVNAWGFGPGGKQKKPTDSEIKELLAKTGYQKIKLEEDRLHMPVNMELDLSAIAKGYGVDELVKFLEYRGYKDLLVEIGGEVRTRGKKEDGSDWRVGIEGPANDLGDKIIKVVPMYNMSMATSGSYRNYIKYGDEIFNHTIDPISGKPVTHKTVSVTVLNEFCADADAWATALMSMGHTKGLEISKRYNLMSLFQVKIGNKIEVFTSSKFNSYLKKYK